MSIILALILTIAAAAQADTQPLLPVEVFDVVELPVAVTDTVLAKTKAGYSLRCVLTNNSEFRVSGLRYSMAVVNSMNATRTIITSNEDLKLVQNQTRRATFRVPAQFRLKADERVVFMLEQVVSTDYIWQVARSPEALTAYIAGDYSIVPHVLRLTNQVDAPPKAKVIY